MESEQLCSRWNEGNDLMELFKISHGMSAAKRQWKTARNNYRGIGLAGIG
jgi:hypothetical protein